MCVVHCCRATAWIICGSLEPIVCKHAVKADHGLEPPLRASPSYPRSISSVRCGSRLLLVLVPSPWGRRRDLEVGRRTLERHPLLRWLLSNKRASRFQSPRTAKQLNSAGRHASCRDRQRASLDTETYRPPTFWLKYLSLGFVFKIVLRIQQQNQRCNCIYRIQACLSAPITIRRLKALQSSMDRTTKRFRFGHFLFWDWAIGVTCSSARFSKSRCSRRSRSSSKATQSQSLTRQRCL